MRKRAKEKKVTVSRKRRRWLLVLIPVALLGVATFHWLAIGIQVTIKNAGTSAIRSVVLDVAGASYSLGDIAAGASAKATVRPGNESHLEIEFTDGDGKAQRLNAGGFGQSGHREMITISIRDGAIVGIEHRTVP